MKAKTASSETAVLAAERKLHNTWVYIKRHWQLYLLFLLPAVALTLVFKYAPMGGVLIAFQKYNPFRGIWGSEWVGFKNFTRFMSSPDFQRYLINTLKLSVYGLLWGFPIPILLAFLLNRIESKKIKQKVQLVLVYAQLHLGHRAVRHRPGAAECHRSGERPASHQHQFHDAAGSIPPHLHHQRHLAGCRLGIHHVHCIPF